MTNSDERFTRCLHHATASTEVGGAFSPPIVNTSVYRLAGDPSGPYQYARWGNPTWSALEDALSILEEAETITFPSGMAAIASVLYSHLKSGDRLLLPSDGYYTVRLFAESDSLAPWAGPEEPFVVHRVDAQELSVPEDEDLEWGGVAPQREDDAGDSRAGEEGATRESGGHGLTLRAVPS